MTMLPTMTEASSLHEALMDFITKGEFGEWGKNRHVNRYYCKSSGKSRLLLLTNTAVVWGILCLALYSGFRRDTSFLRAPVFFSPISRFWSKEQKSALLVQSVLSWWNRPWELWRASTNWSSHFCHFLLDSDPGTLEQELSSTQMCLPFKSRFRTVIVQHYAINIVWCRLSYSTLK